MTTTSTTTTTTTSAITSATQQLLTSLDTGSGVDTGTLVTSLVQAQFAARNDALTQKTATLTAQISGLGTVKSAITGFASALDTLVKGGSLTTQPSSSNTAVLTATALSGAKLAGLSSAITVSQLAAAQATRTTTAIADRTATLGSGQLTLTLGSWSYGQDAGGNTVRQSFAGDDAHAITIDLTDASLDDIAAAITAQGRAKGVTASVVTDADGSAYLSIKGATGAAQGFTLAATSDPDGALAQFVVDKDAAFTSDAQNAKLKVDGIAVERAGNTISDLVDGVKLSLTGTSTTPVALTSTPPTAALSQAVSDFVDTYNQVLATLTAQTDPITGSLRADPAAQSLLRGLKGLTATPLLSGAASGTPTTLGEIGVATNRDGTLKVTTATLTNALATWPDSVEAMFAFASQGSDGISAKLGALSVAATDKTYGLAASETRYTSAKDDIGEQQDKIAGQSSDMTTRLTQQFASMNAKVAAYKSTQTFLKNQIDAWNNSNK